MSDKEKSIELEEQYDDCQKMNERYEHISKAFKTYEEYYSRLINLSPTVGTIINSDVTMIDIYPQDDTNDNLTISYTSDEGIRGTVKSKDIKIGINFFNLTINVSPFYLLNFNFKYSKT